MTTELDIGPLSWVKGEIDLALERAANDLTTHATDPQGKALSKAMTSLHQAHGALAVVGLAGITEFAQGIERLLGVLQQGRLVPGSAAFTAAISAAQAGFIALRAYLDDLMAGQPDQAVRLFPAYKAMAEAAGERPPSASALFFPDLSQRPPKREKELTPLAPDALAARLKAARLGFERGLLKWIKNDPKGAAEMKGAIMMIEMTRTTPAARAYWWAALGVLDALVAGGLTDVPDVKPFALRLGAQVKKLTEGAGEVPERALAEALYIAAIATTGGQPLAVVKAAYRLDTLLPGTSASDAERLLPHLRRLRELLVAAKDDWNRLSAGTAAALPPFHERITKIAEVGAATGQSDYAWLTAALLDQTSQLRRDPSRHNDVLALEMATALLLAETALDDFQALDAEFTGLVQTLVGRLDAASQGETLDALNLPALESMAQRAQEKLLTESVAREIRNNLGAIEQALDAYFRDPTRKQSLTDILPSVRQAEGALIMLDQGRAHAVLRECKQAIERFAAPDFVANNTEFEDVAKKLSALSFFVEQFQGGKADVDALLGGIKPAPPLDEVTPIAAPAEPVPAPIVAAAPPVVIEPPPPAPARLKASDHLADASAEEVNAELLDIFLEEAREVLATMAEELPKVQKNPADQDALTTIRRSVHTLKGSGRMVNLNDLGETAWAVEQVMNTWINDGDNTQPATPELLALLDLSYTTFRAWIVQLEAGGSQQHADQAELIRRCIALGQTSEMELADRLEPLEEGRATDVVVEATTESAAAEDTSTAELPIIELPIDELAIAPIPEVAAPVAPVVAPPATPLAPVVPLVIKVGKVDVSPTLYRLYLEETRIHLATLHAHLGLEAVPAKAAIRASHTTASISAATGFTAIYSLAHALEAALERLASVEVAPTEAQRLLFARCGGALEGMLGAIAECRLPEEEAELAAELHWLTPEQPMTASAITTEPAPEPLGDAVARPEVNLVPVDRRTQRIDDEIDAQLLPLFLDESDDLMTRIGESLRAWRLAPANDDIANALQRALHTLKGSARMAGAMRCGELLHAMESRIEQAAAMRAVQPATIDGLEASYDRAAQLIERLRHPSAAPLEDEAPSAAPHADVSIAETEPVAVSTVAEPDATPTGQAVEISHPLPGSPGQVHLRVRAGLIDQLVNEAGEVAIARSRIEGEMRALKASVIDLTDNVLRLRGQLREIEIHAESQLQSQHEHASEQAQNFDPLEFDRFTRFQEVARMMAESVNDVATVQHTLLQNLDHASASLGAQARLSRELSQRLMSVRRIPFDSLAERLHRVVRQAAKDADKRANLDIRHGQTELDRSMIDTLAGPIEHLLRNSVAHGLEDAATRAAAGKEAIGQVTVSLAQEGNEIVIAIADDGAGLNYARIRERGIQRGLFADGAVPSLTDTVALGQLIFQPGFTTAEALSALSGRGIGMDVVKSATASLGGRVVVSSVTGQGAVFRLYLPLTMAVTQAVLVTANHKHYAIPSSMIEQASEHRPEVVDRIRRERGTEWMGNRYPWRYLPELLGEPDAMPLAARRHWVLLIKGGAERVALEVDSLIGNQEIVIKAIGPQLGRVPGLAGATVLADGDIALILNPIALIAHAAEQKREPDPMTATGIIRQHEAAKAREAAVIMIVDDSLTVRKIGSRLLSRQGYEVLTAKDGVDALEQLGDIIPDVMLVDIEMPRMDGFGLTRNIRADERLKGIPIIMITSRSADKHRKYAFEIGVNHYLGKPYDEEELLARIAEFVGKPK